MKIIIKTATFLIQVLAIATFARNDSLLQSQLEAMSREGKLPDSSWDYSWKEFAAAQCQLTSSNIEKLQNNKLLITNEAYKQVFEPYLFTEIPMFITSDAVLYAYHLLLEESLIELEKRYSHSLTKALRKIWDTLPEQRTQLSDKKLEKEAIQRGQIIIGTALWLLGDSVKTGEEAVDKVIPKEVTKIVAANAVEKPIWLGEQAPGFIAIDYSRFKPRGFYNRSEKLERYARASSWLQAIPFRIENDIEFLAILILGSSLHEIQGYNYHYDEVKLFPDYSEFIGATDAWDLRYAERNIQGNLGRFDDEDITKYREQFWRFTTNDYSLPKNKKIEINDQLRFAPLSHDGKPEPHFRILSTLQTPDVILFQRMIDSGFSVSPSSLLSVYQDTISFLDALGSKKPKRIVDSIRSFFDFNNIYCQYLQTLGTLLSPPEPDAPAFMSKDSWERKSVNSFLSGYSLLKHATVLHAKQSVTYFGATMIPPGFVEPNPEFWGQFSNLCSVTASFFEKRGTFDYDPLVMIDRIEQSQDLCRRTDFIQYLMSPENKSHDEYLISMATFIRDLTMIDYWDYEFKKSTIAIKDSLLTILEKEKRNIQIQLQSRPKEKPFTGVYATNKNELANDWEHLVDLTKEIQLLAHKQLRKRTFTEIENKFLKEFGSELGNIMQYKGNSFLTPRDDSPRIVDISSNPKDATFLEIGVSRPRALYVLYPWNGIEILSRGVVLPYYEFWSKNRLNDKDWLKLLDSKQRPSIPEWLKEITSKGQLYKPKLEKRD